MADPPRMVFLGFGKYIRADRIFGVEPLPADERGSGARTRVWVGAIADAHDRRSVLLRTETGLVVIAAGFLVNSLLAHPQVWALFVLQSLGVAVFSLGRPAMSSLAPRLVPEEEFAAAGALDGVYN